MYKTESGNAPKRKGADLMDQMGFANMSGITDDDDDLEAEFAALTGDNASVKKSSPRKKGRVSLTEIEEMAAQSLHDASDDDLSDTEHPELLSELAELEKENDEEEPTTSDSPDNLPSSSQSTENAALQESQRREIVTRKDQYRQAALVAKHNGDTSTTAHYVRFIKQCDVALQTLDEGKPVDLSHLPPALSAASGLGSGEQAMDVKTNETRTSEEPMEMPPEPTEEEAKKLFQAPEAPKSVMEALTQRLAKYKSSADSATQSGDSNRARRMGRIVKQYENAIKAYRAGKPVNLQELPTPPGFGPIPDDTNPPQEKTTPQVPSTTPSTTTTTLFMSAATVTGDPKSTSKPPDAIQKGPEGDTESPVKSRPPLHRGQSKQDYQLAFLRERQEEFRTAALKAKKMEDLETAKQHIRNMKGIDPMIEALESGHPVDLSQVPSSPLDDNDNKHLIVDVEDFTPAGNRDQLFTQLEQDLISQIRMCATNSQYFTRQGDVPAASKYQKLEELCRKDLESLKKAQSHGDPVPKFHYETRSFTMIQCNSDLGDGEMELAIVRGISFSLPSGYSERDMDTVVKYGFAFPNAEEPQAGQTSTARSTVNPEYGETFKLQIDRKSRSFARFVERKGIKLDIYIKRGFLRGEQLFGSTTVKLSSLDTRCTLHDSFDLADGRKSVGGKLEVKVRVRDPFKGRHVEESQEKWLVIDQFIRSLGSNPAPKAQQTKKSSSFCSLS